MANEESELPCTAEAIRDLVGPLFDAALAADEFEYCCALLRVRGIEPASWDALAESDLLIQQTASLANGPVLPDFRLRLMLFLYCHVTEMDDLYSVPMNMLRILDGDRYSISPFHQGARKEPKYPSEKVPLISELANRLHHEVLATFYEQMLVRQVRNAFFHSDYSLLGGDFVVQRGDMVPIGNTLNRTVPLQWLAPRLSAGINLGMVLIDELIERRRAYKTPKTISSPRTIDAGFDEVTLTVDEHGLVGFRSGGSAV